MLVVKNNKKKRGGGYEEEMVWKVKSSHTYRCSSDMNVVVIVGVAMSVPSGT